jgi:hypothetical protein
MIRARLAIYRKPLILGFSLFGAVILGWLWFVVGPAQGTIGFDAYAYWSAPLQHPYSAPLGSAGAFTYSPAVALFFAPAHLLVFGAFYLVWAGLLVGNLVWLTRRNAFLWLATVFVALELYEANVNLVLATVCVVGLRYPAAWSVALLTKVTPGIGLLWFVVRGEWRSLAIALGATAAIAGVSFAVAPVAWSDWFHFLSSSSATGAVENNSYQWLFPPLWLRLVGAAALIVWGARTDRRWVLPVAMTIAMPVIWITSPAILTAIPRLRRLDRESASKPAPDAFAAAAAAQPSV